MITLPLVWTNRTKFIIKMESWDLESISEYCTEYCEADFAVETDEEL